MVRKLSVIALAVAMLFGTVQASHAVLTAVGPTSPATGYFPVWYQDNNALSLELCLSQAVGPNGPMCVLLPSPPYFDETLPAVFPVNFPDESFWFAADGAIAGSGVDLTYVAALEAAFAVGPVVDGDQVSFARIRIRADVSATGLYTITHPFGVDNVNVTVVGKGREINITRDIGIGAPGNFTGALAGDIGPFLRAAATPGGAPNPFIVVGTESFIGDPNIDQAVTGSPFGTNFLRIEGPGLPGGKLETNLFTLAGKVFSGVLPTNVTVDRSTYSRNAAGASTVDVFSTSENNYTLTFRDTIADTVPPATLVPMVQDAPPAGKFYGRSAPAAVPPYVIVKAVAPLGSQATPTSLASPVVDVVKITTAQYDPVLKDLTIEASSSDNVVPLPKMTAVGYGQLAASAGTTTQRLVVHLVDVPPARVTVKSSGGGADTEPVKVIPAGSTVPVAANDRATTPVNTPVTINALDNDTPAGTLAVVNLTQPANGSAVVNGTSITYTPNNCFTGTDTFTYRASLSGVLSNVATVTVTVTSISSTTPVAVNDGPVGMTQGTAFVDYNVMANDNAFGRPLRIFSVTQPAAGTGSVAIQSDNVTVRYSPPASLFGTVTFTYRATNDVCAVSANSATVTVRVNGKPVANNVSATAPDNTAVPITLSATDPDGNTPLTYTFTSSPTRGTISNFNATAGTFTYTDTTGTNGTTDSFTYTATDNLGAISNTATVTVTVSNNGAVTAGNDTASTPARTPVSIPVLGNDTGGTPPLSVVNLTQPTNGGTTVLNANGTITYTPGGPGTGVCPSGTGTFTYQARDSVGGTSNTATVSVTVNPLAENLTATGSARRTTGNTRADWTINGTTSVRTLPNGTPNTVTVRLRTATGAFIGTANPDRQGRWKISLKGSTVVPAAPSDTIHVTSSYCNTTTATVTVR